MKNFFDRITKERAFTKYVKKRLYAGLPVTIQEFTAQELRQLVSNETIVLNPNTHVFRYTGKKVGG